MGVGVLAQPQLIVRFMTVKSNRELNRAVLIGGVFICAMTGIAFIVGALSNAYFYKETGQIAIAVAKGNSDSIIPLFINSAMPSWFVYVFMITLLSAAMSTLSSQFHAMGTSIGRDFFEKIFVSKKINSILVTKIGIIVAILLSIIIGYKLPGSIIAIGTSLFFGICAATFLPAYFSGLYWKKATKEGAVASILVGFFSSLIWILFIHKKEAAALGICNFIFGKEILISKFPWPVVDPILIALPISLVVMIIVSLFTQKNALPEKHIANCFKKI